MEPELQNDLNELQKLVQKLTKKDYTQKDILHKIRDFLNQNTRYFLLTQFPELNSQSEEGNRITNDIVSDYQMKVMEET